MKPHFFKWTTTSPNKQEIVSNGHKLWIYDDDLEQLIIKKASDDISQFPYLILLSKNTSKIDAMFNVTKRSNSSYQLTPKTDEMISNIVIKFDKNQHLSSLIITTSMHQNTKITFSNVKVNTDAIKESQFSFITPKGADVIDASKG
jgi:outer membrane lipoprotein carrier protein